MMMVARTKHRFRTGGACAVANTGSPSESSTGHVVHRALGPERYSPESNQVRAAISWSWPLKTPGRSWLRKWADARQPHLALPAPGVGAGWGYVLAARTMRLNIP